MKFVPSDYVDADGKVHETVGENIRNGIKKVSSLINTIKKMSNSEIRETPMFPYKAHWELVADTITNGVHRVDLYQSSSGANYIVFSKKVKYCITSPEPHSLFSSDSKITITSVGQRNSDTNIIVNFTSPVGNDDNGRKFFLWLLISDEV